MNLLNRLFPKRDAEAEMEEELREHLRRRTEEFVAQGMSPTEARAAARRQFGRVDAVKEDCREQRGWVWLEQLEQETRLAGRMLFRSPGFACVAVLTLALGIGATTAVFTVANGLLLKPMPWPKSHRVMSVWEGKQNDPKSQTPMAPKQFMDIRQQTKTFKALAGWSAAGINFVPKDGTPERFQGATVTEDFFKVVETYPKLGAGFVKENFQPGKDAVVMIGQGIWRDRFAEAPDVIGKTVRINGWERVIVGVMPAGFQTPAKAQFWLPKVFTDFEHYDRNYKALPTLGRLADGATQAQAQAELETLYAALRKEYPDFLNGWGTRLHPAAEDVAKPVRPALLVLMAAVSAVLLMACVNVANLALARGAKRMGELSVRAALGASRGKLMRQLLIENLVLAFFGASLGLVLAKGLLATLLAAAPKNLPRIDTVHMDWWTLGFTALVCVGSGLLFGATPAWRLSQRDPARELKDAGQRSTASVGWLRRGLAAFQVAASVVVLIGTALLLRSFDALVHQDLGFDPNNLMTVRIELPAAKYAADNRRDVFADDVLRELHSTVGVESAAATTFLPLQGFARYIMRLESNPNIQVSHAPVVAYQGVSEDYLRTMGVRVMLGRELLRSDNYDAPKVCVINQAFVRRFFPEGNPIGQRLEIGFADPPQWLEVVGVVNDVRNGALDQEPDEEVLVPLAQQEAFFRSAPALSLVIRTRGGSGTLDLIRRAVWRVDKDQPLHMLRPMTDILADSRAQRRFTVMVLTVFAGAAALLAVLGLFGVMSGDVAARTREFGIRLALGARPASLTRLALNVGMATLFVGLACGFFGAWASLRLIRSMLYQTNALDPVAWGAVTAGLIAAGLIASYWPARRAGRVDPIIALRHE